MTTHFIVDDQHVAHVACRPSGVVIKVIIQFPRNW